MPTRTINLKMIVNRGEEGKGLRQALWTTHDVLNRAVADIERVLILCRGRGYHTLDVDGEEKLVDEAELKREAIEYFRKVQRDNGFDTAPGGDEEILRTARDFYRMLVRSCELDKNGQPLKGDSQAVGKYVSPMMDSDSLGGLSVLGKIVDPAPRWLEDMKAEKAGWQKKADKWFETWRSTDRAKNILNAKGRQTAFRKALEAGEPWYEAFSRDQEKKKSGEAAEALLIKKMKEDLGLLPCIHPPVRRQLQGMKRGKVSRWDRLACRLAAAHLLAWESWNHRTAAEYNRIQSLMNDVKKALGGQAEAVEQLQAYENERHELYCKNGLASAANPYRLGRRAVRSLEPVLERLAKTKGEKGRLKELTALQAKLAGKFGDPEFFRWLAAEERSELRSTPRVVTDYVKLNTLKRQSARKRAHALYTPPDAVTHPRWIEYEPPKGTNLIKYSLDADGRDAAVTLSLLKFEGSELQEADYRVSLAPSKQMSGFFVTGEAGDLAVEFGSSGETYRAVPGQSEILFDRAFLENHQRSDLASGKIGPVWFKLVLDIESKAPKEWLDARGHMARPPELIHFSTSRSKKSQAAAKITPGFRVLSVDLGLRTFASCSVFELVAGKPSGECLYFQADEDLDFWAKHERSFLLRLPGEKVDKQVVRARRVADDEVRGLRRGIWRLKQVLRLAALEDEVARENAVSDILTDLKGAEEKTFLDLEDVSGLLDCVGITREKWREAVLNVHRGLEKEIGSRIALWRRSTRPRSHPTSPGAPWREYQGGKSLWALNYLDSVRRLLLGWSLHGRVFSEIRRQDRLKRGVFASRLLSHINNLKEDRVKTGADLLVQAARGFGLNPLGKWEQYWKPCRVIIFEDLSRYLFKLDRPRRENSQLMKWNHREIQREVESQAQVFGIHVTEVGAEFSSRFHAASGTPGVRTIRLERSDLENPRFMDLLAKQQGEAGLETAFLSPGAVLPWPGGEFFFTTRSGKAGPRKGILVNADINAAQNLQKRFWTRFKDPLRLPALRVDRDGQETWYPINLGRRLLGGLGTPVRLCPSPDGEGYLQVAISTREWQKAGGGSKYSEEEIQALAEMDGDFDGESIEFSQPGEHITFFRDPSGVICRRDRWYPSKKFWGRVHKAVGKALSGFNDDQGARR